MTPDRSVSTVGQMPAAALPYYSLYVAVAALSLPRSGRPDWTARAYRGVLARVPDRPRSDRRRNWRRVL